MRICFFLKQKKAVLAPKTWATPSPPPRKQINKNNNKKTPPPTHPIYRYDLHWQKTSAPVQWLAEHFAETWRWRHLGATQTSVGQNKSRRKEDGKNKNSCMVTTLPQGKTCHHVTEIPAGMHKTFERRTVCTGTTLDLTQNSSWITLIFNA